MLCTHIARAVGYSAVLFPCRHHCQCLLVSDISVVSVVSWASLVCRTVLHFVSELFSRRMWVWLWHCFARFHSRAPPTLVLCVEGRSKDSEWVDVPVHCFETPVICTQLFPSPVRRTSMTIRSRKKCSAQCLFLPQRCQRIKHLNKIAPSRHVGAVRLLTRPHQLFEVRRSISGTSRLTRGQQMLVARLIRPISLTRVTTVQTSRASFAGPGLWGIEQRTVWMFEPALHDCTVRV